MKQKSDAYISALKVKMERYIRVINIQQPVQTHVHTQRNVHKAAMLLLQTVIDTGQTAYHLYDVYELFVLFQAVLLKRFTCCGHPQ